MPLVGRFVTAALAIKGADRARAVYEVNRRMITDMIADVVAQARARVSGGDALGPRISFSPEMATDLAGLRRHLYTHVYRHPRVMRVMADAEALIRDLFARYLSDPQTLPGARSAIAAALAEPERAAFVCDFVAGMTDRFAIAEHRRLFDVTPELR